MELTKRNSPVLQKSMKSLESGHRCCINKEHNAAMTDSHCSHSFANLVLRTYKPSSATSNAGFTCKLTSLPAAPTQGTASWDGTPAFLHALCECVEEFSGWTDTWLSMKVNSQCFPKCELHKWFFTEWLWTEILKLLSSRSVAQNSHYGHGRKGAGPHLSSISLHQTAVLSCIHLPYPLQALPHTSWREGWHFPERVSKIWVI